MKKYCLLLLAFALQCASLFAQERRPIDSQHPLWLIHIDVWNKADPQKIIDLIPDDVKPYVCMNLSLSCQYDTQKNVYKMPQNAVRTYKSWATVCQANGLWFTCQPASGGHTHIQDNDLETFEYFYKRFPNFLGWNYAEQFWGFDEAGDRSSSTQASRIALFAKLVPMAHKYGGFLTVSFCGNVWSHPLNPIGMLKRNKDLMDACKQYPEAILWLYKYTTSSCFYNNESVTFGPFISGLAKNYGVRYDNCGWNGALGALLGDGHGSKYPIAAGIGTVMEQTAVNGGAVWDGPELIWTADFQNLNNTTVSGYSRRNWGTFPGFDNAWIDMFRKIIDGTLRIPSREEVVENTKIVVINNVTSGNDEQKYAAWGDLYDGLYKQTDPFNRGNGQWMDNFCYFKSTGRYAAIPIVTGLYDDAANAIPVKVNKSAYTTRWSTQTKKVNEFNKQYPELSKGDLYVSRRGNQLVTYTPYTYLNKKKTATAEIPLVYNVCDTLQLTWGKLSSGLIREFSHHIDFYLNNYRSDTTTVQLDKIVIKGAVSEPTYTFTKRAKATGSATATYDAEAKTYTLEVKHNGPVDITISDCYGNNVREDIAEREIEPLSLPKQPEEYVGEIIIEAEDMDYKSIKQCATDPYNLYPNVRGHSGNGFIDFGTSTSAALRHVLNLKQGGDYTIAVRYTGCTQTGKKLTATAGGRRGSLPLEVTATNEWKKAVYTATLKEGNNTLTLVNTSGVGIFIDQIIYTPVGVPAEKFLVTVGEAENGTVTADVDEAAEGDTVTLSVAPADGFALTGWIVGHGGVTPSLAEETEDGLVTSFVMPDDNVTITPVFKDTTVVYALDFTNFVGGTMPEGWRTIQGSDEKHEYPNTYTSGARVFAGFTGYQGKALYWRENCAEYGRLSAYPLNLKPGSYTLSFACAAWKGTPKYKVSILSAAGETVAESAVCNATPNANGNSSANLTSAKTYQLDFDITTQGKYVISFQNNGTGFDEFLLLECRINSTVPVGIANIEHSPLNIEHSAGAVYDLSGRRVMVNGQWSMVNGKKRSLGIFVTPDGKVRKILY